MSLCPLCRGTGSSLVYPDRPCCACGGSGRADYNPPPRPVLELTMAELWGVMDAEHRQHKGKAA